MASISNKVNKPVSQRYLDNAKIQVEYMKHKGMMPASKVLEYGCGILRVGLHLVPYLEDNKYVAADISDLRVEKGVRILKEQGIDPSRYSTVILTDATAKELGDDQFDFIMAHDVFAHMPLDECESCLVSLKKYLAKDGQLLVTFDVSDKPTSTNAKDYWFTQDQIARIAAAANFLVEEQLDWMDFKLPTQETQRMFRFVHPD
ncbi:MAG: class I SAM-dependent methyltransferase [Alphaproteobacteria bacterium]|nr:class I SAM-dependent methyltransferase [Alphaproteobacteria bacterium]